MPGQTELGEHIVGEHYQIVQGIQQRAVQIEYKRVEGRLEGRGLHFFSSHGNGTPLRGVVQSSSLGNHERAEASTVPSKLLSGPHNCNGFPSPLAPSLLGW